MKQLTLSRLGRELLDDPAADPSAAALSLQNIARANRWFGNTRALARVLGGMLADHPAGSRVTLLDVGTGAGDLPRYARRWARRKGIELVPLGLERSRVAAGLAQRAGIPTVVACAGAPPIRPRSVDLVLVSQLIHHLEPDSAVELLRTCDRLARRGVIVSDLRRSALARLAFRAGAGLLRFDPATIHDGVLSIRRGYSQAEMAGLAKRAGVAARVRRQAPFRLLMTWRPRI